MDKDIKGRGDVLIFKNKVKIEVIDKATGKVKQVVETENVTLNPGAQFVIACLDGTLGVAPSPCQVVNLFDSTKTYIKSLTGSFGTKTDTGSAWQNTVTASDTSTDAYSVQYLTLSPSTVTAYPGTASYFANAQSTAISKGASDTLRISWTVSVSYSSAP
jgi:hypothetical protein